MYTIKFANNRQCSILKSDYRLCTHPLINFRSFLLNKISISFYWWKFPLRSKRAPSFEKKCKWSPARIHFATECHAGSIGRSFSFLIRWTILKHSFNAESDLIKFSGCTFSGRPRAFSVCDRTPERYCVSDLISTTVAGKSAVSEFHFFLLLFQQTVANRNGVMCSSV